MIKLMAFLSILLAFAAQSDDIIKKEISYKDGDTEFTGHLFHKKNIKKNAPIVVVIHNYLGITEETLLKADDIAKEGFYALVANIYGRNVVAKDVNQAKELSTFYKSDLTLLRKRVDLAVTEAKKVSSKVYIAGYCFGGTAAIEYARGGYLFEGAVSFHGNLYSSKDDSKIKTRLLVLHGAVDRAMTRKEVEDFLVSLDSNKINYEFTSYSGAVHSFTDTTKKNEKETSNSIYNAYADKRSWSSFLHFIKGLE